MSLKSYWTRSPNQSPRRIPHLNAFETDLGMAPLCVVRSFLFNAILAGSSNAYDIAWESFMRDEDIECGLCRDRRNQLLRQLRKVTVG